MKFREKKKDIHVDLFVVSFTNFQGDSRFLHKILGYLQGSRSQNKFLAFHGFQGAVGTLSREVKNKSLTLQCTSNVLIWFRLCPGCKRFLFPLETVRQ